MMRLSHFFLLNFELEKIYDTHRQQQFEMLIFAFNIISPNIN